MRRLLMGIPKAAHGAEHTAVQAANPMHAVMGDAATHYELDVGQGQEVPIPGVLGGSVKQLTESVREDIPGFTYVTEQVTAYIDRFVPVPWLHGDQRVTGQHG